MPRLPVLIRQNKVFELVVAGRTHAEICRQLDISEDTVARDMQAVGEQVLAVARERTGEVLAVALATYQQVIEDARREYRQAVQRERDWYAGRLDYEHESVSTKTLALEADETDGGTKRPRKDAAAEAAIAALALESESQPLEVKRTRRTVRPALASNDRRAWLALIVDTTREMTELLGIKKTIVEHSGPGGGAIPVAIEDTIARIYGNEDGK
jgi:hypothetical protein